MDFHLYLASASPRRGELLGQLGLRYRQVAVTVEELRRTGEHPCAMVERLAMAKAMAGVVVAADASRPVLGADTMVVVDDQVLGKPRDREDGLAMLAALSGREHEVVTAVALSQQGRTAVAIHRSRVTWRVLTMAECAAYWATGEPCDKAGAYAIQGYAAAFIVRMEGSYSGVMGLPLFETTQLLAAFDIHVHDVWRQLPHE